ncbi:MAG: hypothetical protein AB7U82_00725 [Blastocatellales bacterium]
MMNSIAYNIPVSLVEAYRGRKMIVRARDSSELVRALPDRELGDLLYVQLLSLSADVDALANWGFAVPVDVALRDPATEFPKLYRHAKLLDKHPVRVSMPVAPGFSNAVKVATALNFAVRLEPAQPALEAPEVMNEMFEVLSFSIHHQSVRQPVEYFHSVLLSFFEQQAITLWAIQEEDPTLVRYVTDDGAETISPRFANLADGEIASFVTEFQRELLTEKTECRECEFWGICGGYFKWPRREFDCGGVKAIFQTLREAAGELREDIEASGEYHRRQSVDC